MPRGDVYLANFPFGDTVGVKLRPVLLLAGPTGNSAEVLVAYISSVVPPALLPTDILLDPTLPEHRSTGLRVPSLLRLHKLATIHRSSIQRRLGSISTQTQQDADTKSRTFLRL